MPRGEQELVVKFHEVVSKTIRELLEKKHLYQSLVLETDSLNGIVKRFVEEYRKDVPNSGPFASGSSPEANARVLSELQEKRMGNLLGGIWRFSTETHSLPGVEQQDQYTVKLPSIRISCGSSICKSSVQPHNSGFIGLQSEVGSYDQLDANPRCQCFSFPYQCQNCKTEPLIFLVKRTGLKLTLVGKSQLSEILVPKCIPENVSGFYKKAIIANQTGFILAAALYLRVLIEQHFHGVIPPDRLQAIKGNPTGDELADFYAGTLPAGFPANFPSLKKAYADLSKIIHAGKESDEVKKEFQSVISAVEGHFEAVQVFKKFTI